MSIEDDAIRDLEITLEAAHTEWEAWQRIVRHWNDHSGDINQDNELVAAIRNWGEELVALRMLQNEDSRLLARQHNCVPEKTL